MWSWRAQIISSSSCQLLQHLPQCLTQHWFPIESMWFWEPTEGYINRMFSTFPTQAGKPTQKTPNCSVIWQSWVSQAGMRVINYKRHAVLPQRLVAYVTQSISYRTQSSKLLFITGYVWAVNPMRQRTSEGICYCGPPCRKNREHEGEPRTPEQGSFSPSQAAGEVPVPPTHKTQ